MSKMFAGPTEEDEKEYEPYANGECPECCGELDEDGNCPNCDYDDDEDEEDGDDD